MLQNNLFFRKRDVINITPFLDIMLVLFVVIIVVASFRNNYSSVMVEQKKLKELKVIIKKLREENNLLKDKIKKIKHENRHLKLKNNFLIKENKNFRKLINKFTVRVVIYKNFLTINGIKYSFKDFRKFIKNGIINKVQFYYSRDKKSIDNYNRLNKFLNELGWSFKNFK